MGDTVVYLSDLLWWALAAGGAGSIILTVVEWRKHKPVKRATHADYYVEDKNVKMSLIHDSFLRTRETRVKISSSKSGGGKRRR